MLWCTAKLVYLCWWATLCDRN